VHVILGEKSEAFSSTAVRVRAQAHLPRVTVEVIQDAGHAVSASHGELAAERLSAFLQ
jgi:pimeloyl-ACP methyl ester carboxylesterase